VRIQVLPLPAEALGEAQRTPFILIFDQASTDDIACLSDEDRPNWLRAETGAQSVLVFADQTVEVVK
jgi:hypothetical protein